MHAAHVSSPSSILLCASRCEPKTTWWGASRVEQRFFLADESEQTLCLVWERPASEPPPKLSIGAPVCVLNARYELRTKVRSRDACMHGVLNARHELRTKVRRRACMHACMRHVGSPCYELRAKSTSRRLERSSSR